jgi:gamma-glutamylcyclotransferase (GGCT)/AIG2-like uncharacterized protein YtfP
VENKNYLFVYGTLRKGYDLKLKSQVAGELEYIGQAKMEGSLYDIGRYPGAVKEKSSQEIVGDVFFVNNPDKVFKILDKYEGNEFNRERNKVHLRSGKSVNAWVYWYNQKPEARKRIFYKDYLNYLKFKKSA